MSTKRQRSENWLEADKLLLKVLVMQNVEALANKNTDTNTNVRKVEAWTELQTCFNTMCKGGRRTIPQLKTQWSTIKYAEKKKKLDESETLVKSDEGTPPPPERDPANPNDIRVWLPQGFVENKESDSDTSSQIQPQSPKIDFKKARNSVTRTKISSSTEDLAAGIVLCEQTCRKELHAKQMENERIKKENLLLEQQLLKKKIEYYEEKIKVLYT